MNSWRTELRSLCSKDRILSNDVRSPALQALFDTLPDRETGKSAYNYFEGIVDGAVRESPQQKDYDHALDKRHAAFAEAESLQAELREFQRRADSAQSGFREAQHDCDKKKTRLDTVVDASKVLLDVALEAVQRLSDGDAGSDGGSYITESSDVAEDSDIPEPVSTRIGNDSVSLAIISLRRPQN